jgi:hypothetical protein
LPALEAAAADIRGSFTVVTAEAGCTDEECAAGGEELLPALKLVSPDPGGSFKVATAKAGCTEEEGAGEDEGVEASD